MRRERQVEQAALASEELSLGSRSHLLAVAVEADGVGTLGHIGRVVVDDSHTGLALSIDGSHGGEVEKLEHHVVGNLRITHAVDVVEARTSRLKGEVEIACGQVLDRVGTELATVARVGDEVEGTERVVVGTRTLDGVGKRPVLSVGRIVNAEEGSVVTAGSIEMEHVATLHLQHRRDQTRRLYVILRLGAIDVVGEVGLQGEIADEPTFADDVAGRHLAILEVGIHLVGCHRGSRERDLHGATVGLQRQRALVLRTHLSEGDGEGQRGVGSDLLGLEGGGESTRHRDIGDIERRSTVVAQEIGVGDLALDNTQVDGVAYGLATTVEHCCHGLVGIGLALATRRELAREVVADGVSIVLGIRSVRQGDSQRGGGLSAEGEILRHSRRAHHTVVERGVDQGERVVLIAHLEVALSVVAELDGVVEREVAIACRIHILGIAIAHLEHLHARQRSHLSRRGRHIVDQDAVATDTDVSTLGHLRHGDGAEAVLGELGNRHVDETIGRELTVLEVDIIELDIATIVQRLHIDGDRTSDRRKHQDVVERLGLGETVRHRLRTDVQAARIVHATRSLIGVLDVVGVGANHHRIDDMAPAQGRKLRVGGVDRRVEVVLVRTLCLRLYVVSGKEHGEQEQQMSDSVHSYYCFNDWLKGQADPLCERWLVCLSSCYESDYLTTTWKTCSATRTR